MVFLKVAVIHYELFLSCERRGCRCRWKGDWRKELRASGLLVSGLPAGVVISRVCLFCDCFVLFLSEYFSVYMLYDTCVTKS